MPVHHAKLEADPTYMRRLADLEDFTRTRRSDPTARLTPITIPVVVHIVLPDPGDVSDAQVQEQIDVLNLDFRGENPDLFLCPVSPSRTSRDGELFPGRRRSLRGNGT
jgi:hypothetical protein